MCVHICNLDGPLESRKCRKQQKQIHMISSSTYVCMYVCTTCMDTNSAVCNHGKCLELKCVNLHGVDHDQIYYPSNPNKNIYKNIPY